MRRCRREHWSFDPQPQVLKNQVPQDDPPKEDDKSELEDSGPGDLDKKEKKEKRKKNKKVKKGKKKDRKRKCKSSGDPESTDLSDLSPTFSSS